MNENIERRKNFNIPSQDGFEAAAARAWNMRMEFEGTNPADRAVQDAMVGDVVLPIKQEVVVEKGTTK